MKDLVELTAHRRANTNTLLFVLMLFFFSWYIQRSNLINVFNFPPFYRKKVKRFYKKTDYLCQKEI